MTTGGGREGREGEGGGRREGGGREEEKGEGEGSHGELTENVHNPSNQYPKMRTRCQHFPFQMRTNNS